MPSPASPTLRALRRLVARDPEQPIRLDFGVTRASLAESLRSAVRPIWSCVGEILGGDEKSRPIPSGGQTTASGEPASEPPASHSEPSASRSGGVLEDARARVTRHRRLAPLGACMLLVAVAAVSAMPSVSAAGVPASTAGDSPAPAASENGAVPVTDQTSADPGVNSDIGDGSVINVIQVVGIAPGSSDFTIYVVQGGDTLSKIGARFGVSRNSVYWANTTRLPNPASIRVGLKLLIPPAEGITVTVKASNTLSGFASKYKTTIQKIMAANGMSDATLTVGQLLVIPMAAAPAIPTPKPAPAAGVAAWHGGKLRWPVPGHRGLSQGYWSGHRAIDIVASTGSPVVAAYGGTVIFAGWKYSGSAGYGGGLVVWLSHGGKLYTTYNHLSAETVRVGQVVSAGQHIGSVGMTGNATGPHLHFEVWSCYPWSGGGQGCARNPLSYL